VLVRARALESFSIQINGHPLAALSAPSPNWKQVQSFHAAPALVAGTNRIEVTVTNRAGPALLWLVLETASRPLVSDTNWEVSCAGAVWQTAAPAARARPLRPGNPMQADTGPLHSWRTQAWANGKVLLLAVFLVLLGRAVSRADRAWLTPRLPISPCRA